MGKREVMALLERQLDQVVRIRADSLRSEIYDVLERSRDGRGRVYVRSGGRTHQASAPGDPPARDSGRLQESVKVKRQNSNSYTVGPDPEAFKNGFYPANLEFGTLHIAPRPFMRPALEQFKQKWRA
jgi:HK97 gp10 family phage protein